MTGNRTRSATQVVEYLLSQQLASTAIKKNHDSVAVLALSVCSSDTLGKMRYRDAQVCTNCALASVVY
jgi:hypothetical protein